MSVIGWNHGARSKAVVVVVALVGALITATGPAPSAGAATTPRLTLGDVSIVEGNPLTKTGAKLSLHLSEPAASDLRVNYTTVSGSATGAPKPPPGRLQGEDRSCHHSRRQGRGIDRTGGLRRYGSRERRNLLGGHHGQLGARVDTADDTGVVTILDDDPAGGATLRIGDATVDEGDLGKFTAKVPLSLSEPLGADLLVNYTLVSGSATGALKPPPGDFKLKTGVAKIRAGKTVGTISPSIFPDIDVESDEDLTISITGTSALGVTSGTQRVS